MSVKRYYVERSALRESVIGSTISARVMVSVEDYDALAAKVAHIKAAILEADEIVGDLEGVSISYYLRKAGRTDLLDTLGFTAADEAKHDPQ